jgi:hypothetical protein
MHDTDITAIAIIQVIVLFVMLPACIVFSLCTETLLGQVRGRKSEALLCEKAGIFLRGRYESHIRVKYVLPWVPNPDLSDCPRSAYPLLVVSRLSAWLAVALSLGLIAFGWSSSLRAAVLGWLLR